MSCQEHKAKVKQEQHWLGETLEQFSPRSRSLIAKLEDTLESRTLVARMLEKKNGAHGVLDLQKLLS